MNITIVVIATGAALLLSLLACATALDVSRKMNHALDKLATAALKISELKSFVNQIDDSNGQSLHLMGKRLQELEDKFKEFKTDYGEAALEEMREAAKAEKAWADGVTGIMSYGARFQGRGDNK